MIRPLRHAWTGHVMRRVSALSCHHHSALRAVATTGLYRSWRECGRNLQRSIPKKTLIYPPTRMVPQVNVRSPAISMDEFIPFLSPQLRFSLLPLPCCSSSMPPRPKCFHPLLQGKGQIHIIVFIIHIVASPAKPDQGDDVEAARSRLSWPSWWGPQQKLVQLTSVVAFSM